MAVNKTIYEIGLKDNFSKKMQRIIDVTKQFDDQFTSTSKRVVKRQKKISKGFDSIRKRSNVSTAKVKANNQSLVSSFSGIKGAIMGAVGAFGLYQAFDFGRNVVNLQADFESYTNSLRAGSASTEEFIKNQQFIKKTVDTLGLGLKGSTESFAKFVGSTKGTAIAGQKTRDIFEGMSQAATVLGLSQDDVNGAFRAFGQIASKGTVQSEELKGQIGERLPGAFQIAADAMNVTSKELSKLMKDGKLTADDFLPKFGAELKKRFGKDSEAASKSLRANMNRINNSFIQFKLLVGESMGEAGKGFMIFFNELKSFVVENKQAFKDFFYVLSVGFRNMFSLMAKSIRFIRENKDNIENLTTAFIAGGAALGVYTAAQKLSILWTQRKIIWDKVQLLWTKRLAIWQGILSAAMAVVPAIIFAVGAALVYAWQKFEKFRGVIGGVVEKIKTDFIPILTSLKKAFHQIATFISLALSGSWDKAKEVWARQNEELKQFNKKSGEESAAAYKNGYEKGVNKWKIKMPDFGVGNFFGGIFGSRDEENRKKGILSIAQEALDRKNGITPTGTTPTGTTPTADASTSLGATTSSATTKKATNINIDINKLVENLNFKTTNLQESTSQIEESVTMALLKVLNNANSLANG